MTHWSLWIWVERFITQIRIIITFKNVFYSMFEVWFLYLALETFLKINYLVYVELVTLSFFFFLLSVTNKDRIVATIEIEIYSKYQKATCLWIDLFSKRLLIFRDDEIY